VWLDKQGRTTPVIEERRPYRFPALSPNGRRVAVTLDSNLEDSDLWVYEIGRRGGTQLTRGMATNINIWSPDGNSIVFSAWSSGNPKLFRVLADGSGTAVGAHFRCRMGLPRRHLPRRQSVNIYAHALRDRAVGHHDPATGAAR